MNRHRSIALIGLVVAIWFPANAYATIHTSAQAVVRARIITSSIAVRSQPEVPSAPYVVEVIHDGSITPHDFNSLSSASKFVATTSNAETIYTLTGNVIHSSVTNPYEARVVTTPGVTVSPLNKTVYPNLAAAESALDHTANAYIVDRLSGAVLWSDLQNYVVNSSNGTMSYQTFEEAKAAASGIEGASVATSAPGQTVWQPIYNVLVSGTFAKSFSTLANAKVYASQYPQSVVVDISSNQIVWSVAASYGVYRYLQLVHSFTTLGAAVDYAKTLDHVQVIDSETKQIKFSNYPTFVQSPIGDSITVENGIAVDHWDAASIALAPSPSFMQPNNTYVSDDFEHWYKELSTGDVYVGQWENPYQTLNLETQSTLTAVQFNTFIAHHANSDSVLQNTGQYFIEAQNAMA